MLVCKNLPIGLKAALALLKVSSVDVYRATRFDEHTPLHYAAYNGDAGVVHGLVKTGAKVSALNKYEETATHCLQNLICTGRREQSAGYSKASHRAGSCIR
jgi:hypothetical protein